METENTSQEKILGSKTPPKMVANPSHPGEGQNTAVRMIRTYY